MAFPTVESVTQTQFSSSSTSNAADMPASVSSGDLLVLCCSWFDPGTVTTPTGWTLENSQTRYSVEIGTIFVKISDGTEGGTTVTITTSTATTGAVQTYRVSGWSGTISTGVDSASVEGGSGANPDPPSLTASWGSDDNLWIPTCCNINDDATVDSAPTNYTDLVSTVSGAGINAGCSIGTAQRENATNTEDPGTFTLSESEGWVAFTLAIRGVAAGGVAPTGALEGPLVGCLGGPI